MLVNSLMTKNDIINSKMTTLLIETESMQRKICLINRNSKYYVI